MHVAACALVERSAPRTRELLPGREPCAAVRKRLVALLLLVGYRSPALARRGALAARRYGLDLRAGPRRSPVSHRRCPQPVVAITRASLELVRRVLAALAAAGARATGATARAHSYYPHSLRCPRSRQAHALAQLLAHVAQRANCARVLVHGRSALVRVIEVQACRREAHDRLGGVLHSRDVHARPRARDHFLRLAGRSLASGHCAHHSVQSEERLPHLWPFLCERRAVELRVR
mmetsp:Transcript_43618/g.102377  ORF Transcript_43618/g.102377 Transcript_43618/m.102377 type:complete len:234 (-) Transcript_43618:354-1055(-)